MTLTFHALWMLSALGAAIFAAVPSHSWRSLAALAVGFAASAALLSADRPPDPAWVGVAVAVAAVALLYRPERVLVGAAMSGVLAGACSALLEAQGVFPPAALAVAAVVPLLSAWLSARHPGFVAPAMRDEALLGALVAGLVVAVLPGVLDGWRTAITLSLQGESAAPAAMLPSWTLLLGGAAIAGGGLLSLWSRQ